MVTKFYSKPRANISMEACKFCRKSLDLVSSNMNGAHQACNDRWDWLTRNGLRGKCGKPFRNQEEADMKVHIKCYPDDVPYEGYEGCVRDAE